MKLHKLFYQIFFMTLSMTLLAQTPDTLVVREFGDNGAYATINEAITAASPGDIIAVKPLLEGRVWDENLVISKSLTIYSEDPLNRFKLGGNIILAMDVVDFEYVHLSNIEAIEHIKSSGGLVTGKRVNVNITNCEFLVSESPDYNILLDQDNVDVLLAYNNINGDVTVRALTSIVGNKITAADVKLEDESSERVNHGREMLIIEGNFFNGSTTEIEAFTVRLENDDYSYTIRNNVFKWTWSSTPLHFAGLKPDGTIDLINNTYRYFHNDVYTDHTGWQYLLSIWNSEGTQPSVGLLTTLNNLVWKFSDQSVATYAEPADDLIDREVTGFRYLYTGNFDSDHKPSDAAVVDTGHSDPQFTDLDLTRNDPGAWGGPYSIENHWYNDGTSARIFQLQIPNKVLEGSTISVEAQAIDQ